MLDKCNYCVTSNEIWNDDNKEISSQSSSRIQKNDTSFYRENWHPSFLFSKKANHMIRIHVSILIIWQIVVKYTLFNNQV